MKIKLPTLHAAEQRDSEAQFQMACRLIDAENFQSEQSSEGLKWLRKAAENGHGTAMQRMGLYYEHEVKDEATAQQYFQRAAELGYEGLGREQAQERLDAMKVRKEELDRKYQELKNKL